MKLPVLLLFISLSIKAQLSIVKINDELILLNDSSSQSECIERIKRFKSLAVSKKYPVRIEFANNNYVLMEKDTADQIKVKEFYSSFDPKYMYTENGEEFIFRAYDPFGRERMEIIENTSRNYRQIIESSGGFMMSYNYYQIKEGKKMVYTKEWDLGAAYLKG